MDLFISKSVKLRCNLSKESLRYKPFPSNEFNNIFSFISLVSVAICVNSLPGPEIPETICTISCNFIKFQNYDNTSRIVSSEAPLQSFLIKSKKFQLHQFPTKWFRVNNVSEYLIFSVLKWDKKLLQEDMEIELIINFR